MDITVTQALKLDMNYEPRLLSLIRAQKTVDSYSSWLLASSSQAEVVSLFALNISM